MIKCAECGKEIGQDSLSCPECGQPTEESRLKRKAWILRLISIGMFGLMVFNISVGIWFAGPIESLLYLLTCVGIFIFAKPVAKLF